MYSIFRLCDYGIPYNTVLRLKDNNITCNSIINNPDCLNTVLGTKSERAEEIKNIIHDLVNSDQKFSLNTVIESPEIISNYDIKIDDDKFYKYLHSDKKLGALKIAGLDTLSKEDLIKYIRYQINSNYIFNIEINFYNENPCIKFATILESCYESKRKRYILVFEMLKDTKELRLITMY